MSKKLLLPSFCVFSPNEIGSDSVMGPSLSAKCLIVHLIHIVKICNGLPHFSMSLCALVQSQNATPVNSVRNKWGTSVTIHCIHLFHLLHLLKSLWPSVTIFL